MRHDADRDLALCGGSYEGAAQVCMFFPGDGLDLHSPGPIPGEQSCLPLPCNSPITSALVMTDGGSLAYRSHCTLPAIV